MYRERHVIWQQKKDRSELCFVVVFIPVFTNDIFLISLARLKNDNNTHQHTTGLFSCFFWLLLLLMDFRCCRVYARPCFQSGCWAIEFTQLICNPAQCTTSALPYGWACFFFQKSIYIPTLFLLQ